MSDLSLHDLKALGYHFLNASREKGESNAVPLAFVGLVTVAIGACMILKAQQQAGMRR